MASETRRSIYLYLVRQNYATYAAQLQSQADIHINKEALGNIKLDNLMGPGGAPLQQLVPEGLPGSDPMASPQ